LSRWTGVIWLRFGIVIRRSFAHDEGHPANAMRMVKASNLEGVRTISNLF
jgi:hypothetical protein